MSSLSSQNGRLLGIILAYGFVITVLNLGYNSVYHDEALNILMGRQVLSGEFCPGCAQNTGSVIVQPVLAAIGDFLGGLRGARAVGIPFGLGLTVIIYLYAKNVFSVKNGLLSALIFTFTGTTLYVSKLATYDIVSAFFLGLSFYLIITSENQPFTTRSALLLFAGSAFLFLAAMTKYVVSIFILPLLLYVFRRHKGINAFLFFLLPLTFFIGMYLTLAIYPARESLAGSSMSTYQESQVPFSTLSSWTFRWVAMQYLLAVFGMFHEEKGRKAIPLIILSLTIILLHLITGAEQSVNKNVIFSFIFLTPAAALGVEQMGDLFSAQSQTRWVNTFFTTAVLVVVWAFGLHEVKWLEKQYPDMSPAIDYFRENGFDGMTVIIGSDYGDAVYTYTLGSRFKRAKFLPVTEYEKKGKEFYGTPDYVIIDKFYGKKQFADMAGRYISNTYSLAKDFKIPLSWGVQEIKIFQRRKV